MTTDTETLNPGVPPPVAMLHIVSGFWLSRAVYVAAKLGLADLLSVGPRTATELAAATGTNPVALYRVLRALASEDVFAEDAAGRFSSTPLGETLRSEALRAIVTTELGEEHYPAWGDVLHSVETGEIAFDKVFGMPVWQFFGTHPDNAVTFNRAMRDINVILEEAISHAYDFSGYGRVVDVGGGVGSLLALAMAPNPGMTGVVFDLPQVLDQAKDYIASQGLADRCEFVAGDFFESIPVGADAYLLKWILHDWDDDRCVSILRNCREAIPSHGKILVLESAIPPGNSPFLSKFMDLNMMVMTGGRERTEQEYRALFESAGLNLSRIVPTHAEQLMSIIEGEPS